MYLELYKVAEVSGNDEVAMRTDPECVKHVTSALGHIV